MPFFSRHSIRSRPCRAAAWLAWLLLVVSPLQAAPPADQTMAMNHGHAASIAYGHGQAAPAAAGECCPQPHGPGQPAPDACHCASMCASTLPALSNARLDRVAPAVPLMAWHAVRAPRGVQTRLLRPPAA